MKALTIYQPWASLIIAGAKPYEFRGWSPLEPRRPGKDLIGQRIGVHASAKKIARQEALNLRHVLKYGSVEQRAATCLHPHLAIPVLERFLDDDLPWAVGLGTAILGVPRLGTEIAEEFGLPRVNDSERDEHANWGWPMLDVEPWPEPVPMRGFQGFWNWPTPEGAGL